jgi:[ribosomal protein S5]-alanine N-acetyltransferase
VRGLVDSRAARLSRDRRLETIPRAAFPLSDGVVLVRPFVATDAPAIAQASHDADVLRWTMTEEALTPDRVAGWIAEADAELRDAQNVRLAIVDAVTGAPVGQIGLAPDWDHATGELFYWIAAPVRGRGWTARAVRLVTAWAFASLGLARVEISVDPRNQPSRAVAIAAGFVEEGLLRSAHVFKGERLDTIVYSRLPSDP